MGGDDDFPMWENKDSPPEPDSLEDYKGRLGELFWEIARRFGRVQAQRLFGLWSKPDPGERPRAGDKYPFIRELLSPREYKEWEVLELLEAMRPWPNKDVLAQQLAKKNKTLPRHKRYGSGTTDMAPMRKYIHRAEIKMKKKSPNLYLLLESNGASELRS